MILHLIRVFFLVVVLAFTLSFAFSDEIYSEGSTYITVYILVPSLLALVVVLVDILWHGKELGHLSGLFFGLLAGLVIAYVLSLVVDLATKLYPSPSVAVRPAALPENPKPTRVDMDRFDKEMESYYQYIRYQHTVQLIKFLLGAASVFLCVTVVMQTKDDFRFIVPYVEFAKQTKGARPMVLDTSVIIDGRITDIVNTKILQNELVVPRFVLAELQNIADSQDKLKRNRGRRGLDVLQNLRDCDAADVRIIDVRVPAIEKAPDVDAKLVALAEHLNGQIITNDYNLNKVAQLRNIEVININDLANALKPVVLPGETMRTKIIKPGEEAGQGVGYLDDGTMVVVDQGKPFIGKDIDIIVTSVLQTSAGRMIFGRSGAGGAQSNGQNHSPRNRHT
jgi:uncharacterized protein YacL